MADTRRTWAALDTLFADNTSGEISAQDLRDGFQSLEPHVAATAPTVTDDDASGFDKGHAWIDTSSTPDSLYKCLDASTGAAVWAQVYPASAAAPSWGDITGTLADQTDLNSALGGKAATIHTHTLADVTDAGTAAASAATDFATAAQGALADTAVQGDGITDIVTLTQAAYDALTPDATTLYVVVG